jgi:Leucine-rich repeat (LRR) protein
MTSYSDMTYLSLAQNQLVGSIPVFHLQQLTELRLYENSFTGTLSPEIKNLQKLTFLAIGDCPGLTGPIPREIAEIKALKQLRIYATGIGGSIPEALSSLKHLEYLALSDNTLTGQIPHNLFVHLTALKGLALSKNVSRHVRAVSTTCCTGTKGVSLLLLLEQETNWHCAY